MKIILVTSVPASWPLRGQPAGLWRSATSTYEWFVRTAKYEKFVRTSSTAGQITGLFTVQVIEPPRGRVENSLSENFLQPALTIWSRLAPRWGQPKAVEKISIFDCGGVHHNMEEGCSNTLIFLEFPFFRVYVRILSVYILFTKYSRVNPQDIQNLVFHRFLTDHVY